MADGGGPENRRAMSLVGSTPTPSAIGETASVRLLCRSQAQYIAAQGHPLFALLREYTLATLDAAKAAAYVAGARGVVAKLDDTRVEVTDESRPAVFEVLCDECETALDLDDADGNDLDLDL